MNHEGNKSNYSLRDFMPLIIIFTIIIAFVLIKQLLSTSHDLHSLMSDTMGAFFIIFGGFKIINLKNFAQAYAEYDLLAQRSRVYALSYPFFELFLGIAYLSHIQSKFLYIVTFVIMLISAIGVAKKLMKREQIVCACLGVVFKIPMTYVTLLEDLIMAAMAVIMLMI